MKLRIEVEDGVKFPWWYGIAWCDFWHRKWICYPIPLNILIRLVRKFWMRLQVGFFRPDLLENAYRHGYQDALDWANRLSELRRKQ